MSNSTIYLQINSKYCPESSPIQCYNNNSICVSSLKDCHINILSALCNSSKPFYCLVNKLFQCVSRIHECDCPEDYIKCSSLNKCLSTEDFKYFCPQIDILNSKCSESFPILCMNGVCRKSMLDCPSPNICPLGYFLCPNNECKIHKADCNPISRNCSKVLCSSDLQTCVNDINDCPTTKTCLPKNNVANAICPDGICAENELFCNVPPQNSFIKAISCGSFKNLCEDNICRETCIGTSNLIRSTNLFTNFIVCPADQIKCSDFSCRDHVSDCLNITCELFKVIFL